MKARIALIAVLLLVPLPVRADPPPTAQDRSVDPVILTGKQLPSWSAGPDPTFREPQPANDPAHLQSDCYDPGANTYDPSDTGDHSCYQSSRLPHNPSVGAPVSRLLGYRWNGRRFVQIPFQVDERFTRYLTNNVSGFAFYSGADHHNTYAFDREGFRYTSDAAQESGGSACLARPAGGIATTPDPVAGLDDDDELVFMWRDAGRRAPAGSRLPRRIEAAYEIAVADPSNPGALAFAYVMLAAPSGPAPAYDASNGYVRYARDANADTFVFSESSYENYGAAAKGPYCHPDGTPDTSHGAIAQRRPLDTAWVRTPRYSFRYDGRWLMTELHVSNAPRGDWSYGPDVIDRWKARAFAQDPSSETPCCGYEEEDTNWGGSSILMGERSGPVRTIRETWGADSSTNNVRREVFYRDQFVWGDALRVHPIPPLDGIYSQWDFNAGIMTQYFNATHPAGVAIDGQNDELYGNLDDPCNSRYDGRESDIDGAYRQTYKSLQLCNLPYHLSMDVADVTHSVPTQLQWEQTSGPFGTVVTRTSLRDVTPGGAAQSLFAVPYYRDDSCFDDGTGSDPGPKLNLRSGNEPSTVPGTTAPRKCWAPGDPLDQSYAASPDAFGDERYYQGSIGTQGLHLLLIAESDNLYLTVPVTEIDSEQRVVVLPGNAGNVGERYGHHVEMPLAAVASPL